MGKVKIVKKLNDKGFPTHNKKYREAHAEADNAEKKKYPKVYKAMKKVDKKLGKHELSGKNLKSGKILISKKVPKKDRKDVILHEKTENKAIKRLSKKGRN